ncbi:hypothetical protein BDV32DRAFT_75163 [Aspergillus pseudonomiae]|uniref:Uncharacterized protein n=1 Tax=Aspergillus pseudonomiae TaxID=1506151 RepID=A0A5N7D670_9EURO|nr:uncharacterized protein BDV37DRAFT_285303 [Aspergillus pseudonomiae]KAB8264749.1 hypothetical protein BDV32DRAFT_75163 [Aspergillus pseudonomiae]KAE8401901.1 hypothetical protein BDV37DRAFT_285303 [Aspergillus pseudonomiae]
MRCNGHTKFLNGKPCSDFSRVEGLYHLLRGQGKEEMLRLWSSSMVASTSFYDEDCIALRFASLFFTPRGILGEPSEGFRWVQLEVAQSSNACSEMSIFEGFRQANVWEQSQSQQIMYFLGDMTSKSAMSQYIDALTYRTMIVGIGLDSLKTYHPPFPFEDVFHQAREDGFTISCHYDVHAKDFLRHIAQAIDQLCRTGSGGIDHGLHATDSFSFLFRWNKRASGDRLSMGPLMLLRPESDSGTYPLPTTRI